MEDARFVRFVDDDGTTRYYATYTAYDGAHISQQLLETADFLDFTSSPMVGPAAAEQGAGPVPTPDRWPLRRPVPVRPRDERGGLLEQPSGVGARRSPARCRPGRGRCSSSATADHRSRPKPAGWCSPTASGRCGPTASAPLLLDLDEPDRVIGQLREPLVSPAPDEQDGYVPNVVYSCGALVHAGTLVIPYGIGDSAIGIATVPLPELLEALTTDTTAAG